MSKVRIIGIGSPFGDDRIGWDAIEAIDKSGMLDRFEPGAVQTFCCDQPAVSLLPLMSGANAVILIDATRSGEPPGAVRKIDPGDLLPDPAGISSHGMSVAESLALGRALGMLPGTVLCYGIEIGNTEASSGVQESVRAAVPILLCQIAVALQELSREIAGHDISRPDAATSGAH